MSTKTLTWREARDAFWVGQEVTLRIGGPFRAFEGGDDE